MTDYIVAIISLVCIFYTVTDLPPELDTTFS